MSNGKIQRGPIPKTLAALGIVYGDIGTSPLYSMKAGFSHHTGLLPTESNVLAVTSMFFWTIILVVSVKYVIFVLRADHKGEGGILTLMSLAAARVSKKGRPIITLVGLVGVGLFLGDAVITPAVSVLSAVEGLHFVGPHLSQYVFPLAICVLIVLFSIQQVGTGGISRWFSPIMMAWFFIIGSLGFLQILREPIILNAVNPYHVFCFIRDTPKLAFISMGAVILCVTGAEALYADMGHFGRKPIQNAWLLIVLPALLLNYFGQGSLLITTPQASTNPFYLLAPSWMIIPLVGLATIATVIASQAVISGTFSVIRQAIQLGFLPRQEIRHTSDIEIGQIYLPLVNRLLLACVLIVVFIFEDSSSLTAAYGIAVTSTMLLTSILLAIVAHYRWGWSWFMVILVGLPLLLIDLGFLSSNVTKLFSGGWLPILFALVSIIIMTTWKKGRQLIQDNVDGRATSLISFLENIKIHPPVHVPGTAVFLARTTNGIPHAMVHNLKHNKVLHDNVVFLTVMTLEVPDVESVDRVCVTDLGDGFWQVVAFYGYKESPDMVDICQACSLKGLSMSLQLTSFFLSHETLLGKGKAGMSSVRESLFIWMNKNALKATDFFHIPTNRVVELGVQIEI
ncbi:potassium transporter Kup [Aeromonas veronii]|uniref:potassium transporter Kup n=1 Tax=Aeromonas veronii TaxID=654 RepID=UPI001117009B|nr:potassium transporter Kup [Aeromonas veronii]TNI02220.1 potassium transporter Kup [Aeromonas veronii]HDO1314005.1 potassium transporter Kup [Aeromonas veronii]